MREQLTGLRHGYVDIDQLGMCYPARADDPDREVLQARVLGGVVATFAAAGAELVVVSGCLAPRLLPLYEEVVGDAELHLCLLSADPDELRRRILERGCDEDEVRRVQAEAAELEAGADPADTRQVVLHPGAADPRQVARLVLERTGVLTAPRGPATAAPPVAVPSDAPGRVLWLCGPKAVGKSVAGWALFQALLGSGVTAGFADLAQLGFFSDPPADDPQDHRLRAANLAALWSCFAGAGASHLVLAGAVDTREDVERYRRALPAAEVTVVRLRAGADDLAGRVASRGRGGGPEIAGEDLAGRSAEVLQRALAAALADQERLDAAAVEDVCVDTGGLGAEETAQRVLAACGDLRP
ncbi:hypothetical protein GCM10023225_30380 [Kineococcus glutinatus]|uniref:Gluconate kinase n=1 Tax=Kineococcus glutinatus TaxID=1070872 RepID=A0ABP9I8T9_9ACTN